MPVVNWRGITGRVGGKVKYRLLVQSQKREATHITLVVRSKDRELINKLVLLIKAGVVIAEETTDA